MLRLGPPWRTSHVDAGLAIEAGGDRLVVAAMLGLGAPVGLDAHFLERLGARPAAQRHEQRAGEGETRGDAQGGTAVETVGGRGHGSGFTVTLR